MLYLPFRLSVLVGFTAAFLLPSPQDVSSNSVAPGQISSSGFRIPTVQESAVMARRILRYENLGTMSTVFPSGTPSPTERRPTDVAGLPLGLMEYFADCETGGDPTFIGVNISSTIRNAHAGSNITLSLRWHPPHPTHETPASLPRFALFGSLEWMTEEEVKESNVKMCFAKYHPDVIWMPGNDIHESHWARLKVEEVYWFGGFGDRAYIGWIPLETWQNVTEKEIESIRLPGERRRSSIIDWIKNIEL